MSREKDLIEYVSEWPPKLSEEDNRRQESVKCEENSTPKLTAITPIEPQNVRKKRKTELDLTVAKTAMARWYRQNRLSSTQQSDLPRSAKTALSVIKKSTAGAVAFLERRAEELSVAAQTEPSDPHLQHALATYHEELGRFETSLSCVKRALSLLRLDPDELARMCHVEYLDKIRGMGEFQRELLWLHEKLKLAVEVTENLHEEIPAPFSIERRDGKTLTVEEFRTEYVAQGRPLIITGMFEKLVSERWDLDLVKKVAGSRSVMLKRREKRSCEWARLDPAQSSSVSDFITGIQEEDEAVQDLYLFDWSLPLFCPELNERLTLPRFFQHDFLKKTSTGSLYRDSWPSLFIAPKGVVSDLHVDAFASHFWMFLFQGRKKWTFFQKQALPHLKPNYESGFDPVFDCDVDKDSDLLKQLKPVEIILEPNELLFVPEGSPHHVVNFSDSLAVSGNFVDETNLKDTAKHLRRNALVDSRAGDLLAELVELSTEREFLVQSN